MFPLNAFFGMIPFCKPRAKHGVALITALLLTTFLLTISIARLALVEQGYVRANREAMRAQAYYLALSGMHYYARKDLSLTAGITVVRAVPQGDTTHFFELSIDGSGTVRCRGVVLNSSKRRISEKILALPPFAKGLQGLYDTGQ